MSYPITYIEGIDDDAIRSLRGVREHGVGRIGDGLVERQDRRKRRRRGRLLRCRGGGLLIDAGHEARTQK